MKKIRIGTRESKLAMVQTGLVAEIIKSHHEVEVEIISMKTTGDIILDRSLDKVGGKGLFVKELDMALMENRTDISVHSLKDMPMIVPDDLPILAFSKREDPRDVLVHRKDADEIDFTKPIGCSSKRRTIQLQKLFPNAEFKGIRGNVLTRLEKLDSGEFGAIVLAAAGLNRLGLNNRISRYFTTEEVIPSAGQGILAIQGRKDVDINLLNEIDDEEARQAALCERSFVRTLDGGCSSPIAAFAEIKEEEIILTGLYAEEDMKEFITGSIRGPVKDGEELGVKLANILNPKKENKYNE